MDNSSTFSQLWNFLFSFFDLAVAGLGSVVDFMSRPVSLFLQPNDNYGAFINLVLQRLGDALPSDVTVLSLMFGAGILIYLAFSIVKFFVPIL